jgi:hypothetical protein
LKRRAPYSQEKLRVVEGEAAVYVVMADDPDDWVACFHKSPGFAALEWARRMTLLHNQGLASRRRNDPSVAAKAAVSHHSAFGSPMFVRYGPCPSVNAGGRGK